MNTNSDEDKKDAQWLLSGLEKKKAQFKSIREINQSLLLLATE